MREAIQRLPAVGERDDPASREQWLPLVYKDLRLLRAVRMARESAGHTLQPTALVHEAWLRLATGRAASITAGSRCR